MWDVRLVQTLERQSDLIGWWQLRDLGWREPAIDWWVRHHRWRAIHKGVFAAFRGPLTQRQRWIAAVLTAPGTYLAGLSAAACWGFHEWDGEYETVVRAGSGGKRRYGPLLVARSTTLEGQTTRRDGIPLVTAPRALVDLAPHLGTWHLGRGFREACRLRTTTAAGIAKVLRGQRGTRALADLCDRYATIPYHRCRSDAESRGLEILHEAGIEPPKVNVQVNGPRPDFTWRKDKLIIEVDGGQYHLFADEDARKTARWEAVGYRVSRITSDDVYFHPERLVTLYRANVPDPG